MFIDGCYLNCITCSATNIRDINLPIARVFHRLWPSVPESCTVMRGKRHWLPEWGGMSRNEAEWGGMRRKVESAVCSISAVVLPSLPHVEMGGKVKPLLSFLYCHMIHMLPGLSIISIADIKGLTCRYLFRPCFEHLWTINQRLSRKFSQPSILWSTRRTEETRLKQQPMSVWCNSDFDLFKFFSTNFVCSFSAK